MHENPYVFSQLASFLDRNHFNYLVQKYSGDRDVKHFTCWNQLLALMFGQLSNRDELRALIVAVDAHRSKCYHLGVGRHVTRSNLAKANENRDFRIFEDFAYHMIELARKKRAKKIFGFRGHVYAFDSTTIDLCLELVEWAKFRTTKGGVTVHTLLDVETQVPSFLLITEGKMNDVKAMDSIPYETRSYYVFDRDYNDFERLPRIDSMGCFFIIRARRNSMTSRVAELYKNRWLVELFFKWLKQHLKIMKFWGTSENAVKIQIHVTIITYCLVAIVHHDMKLNRPLYEILQILGISLFMLNS